MRRKVTCTASSATGERAALLLAQLDLAALVVLRAPHGLAVDVRGAAGVLGFEPRVLDGGWPDAAGSELVVLDTVDEEIVAEVAARCAGASVVVATGTPVADVERVLEGTLLPRARVIGVCVEGAGPITTAAAATQLADAILRDRRALLRAAVLCRGEGGAEGVHARDVHIGAGGVQAIVG